MLSKSGLRRSSRRAGGAAVLVAITKNGEITHSKTTGIYKEQGSRSVDPQLGSSG